MARKPSRDDTTAPETGEVEQPAVEVTASESPVIADPGEALGAAPQMPEVQDGAVDAAREAQSTAAESSTQVGGAPEPSGQTDFKGRPFDKILHEVNPDGSPRLNRDGYICCRRGAPKVAKGETRPSRSKIAPKEVKGNPSSSPATVARTDPEPQIQATAQTTTVLVFAMGQMIGGEEFKPEAGEPESMQGAFANYYRAKGIQDIPPGVALSIVCASYVLKRWNKPQFKERRESWWMKARRWWNDFVFRRKMARQENVEGSPPPEMKN